MFGWLQEKKKNITEVAKLRKMREKSVGGGPALSPCFCSKVCFFLGPHSLRKEGARCARSRRVPGLLLWAARCLGPHWRPGRGKELERMEGRDSW